MSKKIFDDAEIELACPGCGHKHQKTLGWLQSETTMTCDGCSQVITLENEQLRNDMGKVDDAWNNLLKSFKK